MEAPSASVGLVIRPTADNGSDLLPSSFDYSQWQRTSSHSLLGGQRVPSTPGFPALAPDSSLIFTVGKSPGSGLPSLGGKSSVTDKKTGRRASAKLTANSKLLQILIQGKNHALKQYRDRSHHLLENNLALRDEIIGEEEMTHGQVKGLLRKYERLRGGISTMGCKTAVQIVNLNEEIAAMRLRFDAELAAVQKQVEEVDSSLIDLQSELQFLLNYKDNEYPVKFLHITELQNELNQVKLVNKADEDHLEEIVSREIQKLEEDKLKRQHRVAENALQTTLSQLHPSLREMAIQNAVITKEIEFHEREVEEISPETGKLERDLVVLAKTSRASRRSTMDPTHRRAKCSPDEDVILDIPHQQWLPI